MQQLPDRAELDRTPATLALLGDGCRRCQQRWRVDARVAALIDEAREEARQAAEEAHQAAGRPRTPERTSPAPTATLPPLVAAPPPAPARRVPDPHYYTRRPWPPEDTP